MGMQLDVGQYNSVSKTVKALNNGEVDCSDGVCIVFSNTHHEFYLLVRSDRQTEGARVVRDVFNIETNQELRNPVLPLASSDVREARHDQDVVDPCDVEVRL